MNQRIRILATVFALLIGVSFFIGYFILSNPPTDPDGEDTVNKRPIVEILNPDQGSTLSGMVEIEVNITDEEQLNALLFIDGVHIANFTDSYQWNTESLPDGKHTILVYAEDSEGKEDSIAIEVELDNHVDIMKVFNGTLKAMVYNIKESGLNDDWKTIRLYVCIRQAVPPGLACRIGRGWI